MRKAIAVIMLLTLISVVQANTVWLTQDQPYTIYGHTVTVVDVNNDANRCGVNVDGVTRWIDLCDSKFIMGIEVMVVDAVAVYTPDYDADTCHLALNPTASEQDYLEEICGKHSYILGLNDPHTCRDHTFILTDIDPDDATFSINGASYNFDIGESQHINGMGIFLKNCESDFCEIYIESISLRIPLDENYVCHFEGGITFSQMNDPSSSPRRALE